MEHLELQITFVAKCEKDMEHLREILYELKWFIVGCNIDDENEGIKFLGFTENEWYADSPFE